MKIYLHDLERDEEIKVSLAVEYALPCHDLFAVLSTRIEDDGTACQEHQWRKVIYFIGASFTHANRLYTATFGFFLDGQQLVPLLVDGACADGEDSGFPFGFAEQSYGHYFAKQTLFHYPEIPSLLEGEGNPLTFREAAAKAMEGDYGQNRAYALTNSKRFTLDRLVGHSEFSGHMDRMVALPGQP